MSQMLFRLAPSKYMRQELQKEIGCNRCWLNHYEFVDFTIFEYGHRGQYLQWRIFSLIVTVLLTSHVFVSGSDVAVQATPYSRFIYIHAWLGVLSMVHSVLEVMMLGWTFYSIPSPVLVRMHSTPWNFKLLWLMYNTLYPNIMACNLMYYVVLKDMETHIGESRLFNALLASFVGIQISVTATPTRLAHMIQPLIFNALHIVFTIIYQMMGFTNPQGQNYVYMEMDWVNSRLSAIMCFLVWLLVTSSCHLLMVGCCWYRRLVYRCRRAPSTKPIYGFSPEEYFTFSDETPSQLLDQNEKPKRHKGREVMPLGRMIRYSPHRSYREAALMNSEVKGNISDSSLSSGFSSVSIASVDESGVTPKKVNAVDGHRSRTPKRRCQIGRVVSRITPHHGPNVSYSSCILHRSPDRSNRKKKCRRSKLSAKATRLESDSRSTESLKFADYSSTSAPVEGVAEDPEFVSVEPGQLKIPIEKNDNTRTEAASEQQQPTPYISDEENDSLSESIGHSSTAFL